MRKIKYRKKHSLKNRWKMIKIDERTEDKECKTHVQKSFIYIVKSVNPNCDQTLRQPEIFTKKALNTKIQNEKFSFRVKGYFFMVQGRNLFKVKFCHTLKIDINWKIKVFSPNKSVTKT